MTSLSLTKKELITAMVYGDTFNLYDEAAFDEFLEPLKLRLLNNKIDSALFKGKRCLDAGCGGGRGSILMAQLGAAEVVGVDMSAKNIETCIKRAAQKGFQKALRFEQHSLTQLPFPDGSFDIVWCNGVLHHTAKPDQGLKEITRVLKTNGNLWLYLYGSGGIYWFVMDWIRELLKDMDLRECILFLRLMDTPVRRVAEYIDDWFTSYLRRYTHADVERRLRELGYSQTSLLVQGVTYDTSLRRANASVREKALMGEGDLRYFCRKTTASKGDTYALPDPSDGKGSAYKDASVVTGFQKPLASITKSIEKLEKREGHRLNACRIVAARYAHQQVRSMLENPTAFDTDALTEAFDHIGALLEEWVRSPK